MKIHSLSTPIERTYYEYAFLVVIESYMTYLRNPNNIRMAVVSDHQNYKYEGDFYGLLDDFHIPKKYHLILTRVNGFNCSNDFNGKTPYLIITNPEVIELIKNIYDTKNF